MSRLPYPAKAAIVARGYRQKEVAEAVGVNAHTFGRILNRHVEPWPELRRQVAEYLNVPEDDLWTDPVERAAAELNRRSGADGPVASPEVISSVAAILRAAAASIEAAA